MTDADEVRVCGECGKTYADTGEEPVDDNGRLLSRCCGALLTNLQPAFCPVDAWGMHSYGHAGDDGWRSCLRCGQQFYDTRDVRPPELIRRDREHLFRHQRSLGEDNIAMTAMGEIMVMVNVIDQVERYDCYERDWDNEQRPWRYLRTATLDMSLSIKEALARCTT